MLDQLLQSAKGHTAGNEKAEKIEETNYLNCFLLMLLLQ
jgi:hypothetical protein